MHKKNRVEAIPSLQQRNRSSYPWHGEPHPQPSKRDLALDMSLQTLWGTLSLSTNSPAKAKSGSNEGQSNL